MYEILKELSWWFLLDLRPAGSPADEKVPFAFSRPDPQNHAM